MGRGCEPWESPERDEPPKDDFEERDRETEDNDFMETHEA